MINDTVKYTVSSRKSNSVPIKKWIVSAQAYLSLTALNGTGGRNSELIWASEVWLSGSQSVMPEHQTKVRLETLCDCKSYDRSLFEQPKL